MGIVFCIYFFIMYIHIWQLLFVPAYLFQSRYDKRASMLLFSLLMGYSYWMKMQCSVMNIRGNYAWVMIIMGLYLLFCCAMLKGKLFRRLLVFFVLIAVENVVDLLTLAVSEQLMHLKTDLTWQKPHMILYAAFFDSYFAVFSFLFIRIWKKKVAASQEEELEKENAADFRWLYIIVILFLFGQFIFAASYWQSWMAETGVQLKMIVRIAGSLSLLAADLLVLLLVVEVKAESTDRETLKNMRLKQEEERLHYEMLMQETQEASKLRHDYQNHMETVLCILESDEKQGREYLREMMKKL